MATILLNMAIHTDGDPVQALAASFGSLYRLYSIGHRKFPGILALVLLANTPQILLSFLYLAYKESVYIHAPGGRMVKGSSRYLSKQ